MSLQGWFAFAEHTAPPAPQARGRMAGRRTSRSECRGGVQLPLDLAHPLEMPRTLAECREPGPFRSEVEALGMCPMFRCRHNLALWVRSNRSIKVEIGHVAGATLRGGSRRVRGQLDRMVDMIIALGDRLGTLCVFDLVPDTLDHLASDHPYMSYRQIGDILGLNREMARTLVDEADHARDIEEKRAARAAARARQELVQIRRRPGR